MKLIIDIDEEIYNRIKSGCPESSDCFKCQDEVLNGTPLEEELEKIKAEMAIKAQENLEAYKDCLEIVRKHISELKGENNG